VQRLLVKLLAGRGLPVGNDELMGAIWDQVPGPGATVEALHHLVTATRKRLAEAGLEGALTNANGTYRLGISPTRVDVHVFRDLAARGRELARSGDPRAITELEDALALRRGEPLAGLRGQWVDGYRHTLTEELRAAELALYETAIKYGESRERLPGLTTLLRERPEDELVAWLCMHALYRSGKQAEALEVKRQFSAHLLDTNGVESGKALDDLYQRILVRDDRLLTLEAVGFPPDETGTRVRQLGRPDPRDGHGAGHEEPREPEEDTAAKPAGSTVHDRPESTAPGPSLVFNGTVNAKYGVFGTQIVNGRS
jgi:DNA-binding SARP family transcriptional activator